VNEEVEAGGFFFFNFLNMSIGLRIRLIQNPLIDDVSVWVLTSRVLFFWTNICKPFEEGNPVDLISAKGTCTNA
jgi:hypothetical protein